MFVLGIEAATTVLGVAVVKDEVLLAERFLNNQRTHSTNLLLMIKGALEDSQVSSGQLSGIAVSIGPGSFTGLRIGLATAKTLAQVWSLPLVGVGTLEALAYPLAGFSNLVCPVINARKNEVYAAVFSASPEGSLKSIIEPASRTPAELVAQLKKLSPAIVFVGDGALTYKEIFSECLGDRVIFAPGELSLPRGAAVAGMGRRKLLANKTSDPLLLAPLYLRASEAEIKWRQKQKSTPGI